MRRVLSFLLLFTTFNIVAADTVLKWYRPFGEPINQQKPVVIKKSSGLCSSQSQRIIREDALRCQAEGQVYDPCFMKTINQKTTVICPQSPWKGESTEIVLQEPLKLQQMIPLDMSRTYPWAIELSNGTHCLAVDPGASFDKMPIRFLCNNKSELVGYLQRCNSTWRILEKKGKDVVMVDLSKAWF